MNKKIFALLFLIFFLFGPTILPDNFQFSDPIRSVQNNDVIIIFNSGGWGNTPLNKAQDFAPIISGIQQTLDGLGHNSVVISYQRTKQNLWGKISGAKEFFNYFAHSSQDLAVQIEVLNKTFPDKKIILAGLSNGGDFVNKTYEKLSGKTKSSVYAITAGTPFWANPLSSNNILQLDNNGQDSLVKGNVKSLLPLALQAPFEWLLAKIDKSNASFSQFFHINGHDYPWNSSKVSSQIISFLDSNF